MERTAGASGHRAGRPRGLAPGGRRAARVAIGGIAHETNTFAPGPTTLEDFRRRCLLSGDALVGHNRGARTVLGGIVAAADEAGLTLLPTLFAAAPPGGTVTAAAWDHLRSGLLDRLRALRIGPWPLDGVVLALHGALVADGEEDAEGALLREVRAVVGPDVPVVATLDSHANVSPAMVAAADLLLGYRTYPHVDTVARGREAVARLLDLRAGVVRPVVALRQLPLLAPLPPQRTTGEGPMAEVVRAAAALAAEPGVLDVAVAGGFPYADVPRAGLSVRVATDGDRPLAEELADRLAAAVWARWERFATRGLDPDEAIARALATPPGRGPTVLAEIADNPGAGAPGNGTVLLERLLALGVSDAVLGALADPAAVAAAFAAGEGAAIRVALGDPARPLAVTGTVRRLGDGVFTARGPMASGGPTRLGRTAVLAIAGVEVVVCERSTPALDPALFRAVGIEPRQRRVIAVKSSVHFRAAFEPLAAAILEVETPGLSGSDLAALPYRRVRRPIVPLDRRVRYLD